MIRLVKSVASILGTIAAAIALAGIGWAAAVAYHGLANDVSAIHTAVKVTELSLENDRLKDRVRAQEAELDELHAFRARVGNVPLDRDWTVMSEQVLELLAANLRLSSQLTGEHYSEFNTVTDMLPKVTQIVKGYSSPEDKLAAIQEYVERKDRWFLDVLLTVQKCILAAVMSKERLTGAGLMTTETIQGETYSVITKHPDLLLANSGDVIHRSKLPKQPHTRPAGLQPSTP
jgi:hypothetical protein